ncbi:MAG: glycosyltransferase family 2 protein [Pseudomonadota bacterium]
MATVGYARARVDPPPYGGDQLPETYDQVSDEAHDWGFEEAGTSFVSPQDQAFSRRERDRVGTDVASNVICYGLTSAHMCAGAIAHRFSVPHIGRHDLETIARVCSPADIPGMVSQGAVPVSWTLGHTSHAAILPASRRHSPAMGERDLDLTALTTRQEFGDGFRLAFSRELTDRAANQLAAETPEFSASRRLSPGQVLTVSLLATSLVGLALFSPNTVSAVLLGFASVYFLSVVALRALALWPAEPVAEAPPLEDHELPFYSVLVPLFKEAHMVPQLLDGLCSLDYPAALLDIKIILEASDRASIRAVRAHQLPGCFEVIIVPPGSPQTKPRALNYGLPFAVGELITIYDAEDIPEPDQLRKAAAEFAAGPENLGCLQAALTYYNPTRNWLTRQFALEYASLFDVLLPALSAAGLPLPLGGTSNHFRTEHLRAAGGWDAYNVTEDADLGLRLDRLGYRIGTLDSTTYEEAAFSLGNWLRQRSRWLKGWMQTWLVHMRHPVETWQDMGTAGFAVFQILMGGMVISALVHPFFLAAIAYGLATGSIWPAQDSLIAPAAFALQAVVLILGYGVAMETARRAAAVRGLTGLKRHIWTMPFYWLLMSVAGWYAVWQLITAPFYWEKTVHGMKQSRRSSAQ